MQFRTLVLLMASTLFLWGKGQSLPDSRQSSFYTYYYRISGEEFRELLGNSQSRSDLKYFHTLVDSVPTDRPYEPALAPGYYLRVFSSSNQLVVESALVGACEALVLNNGSDLQVQVFDPEGNPVQADEIRLRKRQLKWDPDAQTYGMKNVTRSGILEVRYEGLSHFYDLKKTSYKKGTGRKILRIALIPVKIVWRPVVWALYLPIDIVRSVKYREATGSVRWVLKPIRSLRDRMRYRSYGGGRDRKRDRDRFPGYMVFSKPKYRPGDTLRVKVYAENRRHKAKDDSLTLSFFLPKTTLRFKVGPQQPGSFSFELPLTPELEMSLDRAYKVQGNFGRRDVRSAIFYYEDYELKEVEYGIRTDKEAHHPGDTLSLFATAKDANGLTVADAKLRLRLVPEKVSSYLEKQVFLPDVLWELELPLKPEGETQVRIPDSIFPAADLSYRISASLFNVDGELLTKSFSADYQHERQEVRFDEIGLGFRARLFTNGQETQGEGILEGYDQHSKRIYSKFVQLPMVEEIDPWINYYVVRLGRDRFSYTVPQSSALVSAAIRRKSDSLFVSLNNPRKLPISYQLYRLESEIQSGSGTGLEFADRTKGKKNHYLALQYVWKGSVQESNYAIPLVEKRLSLAIEQPEVIVPGQKADLVVEVRDVDGDAVPEVDLLAYGLNSQFKAYSPPILPSFEKKRKAKRVRRRFDLRAHSFQSSKLLDYAAWKGRMGLDSIQTYQFLYPGNGIYSHLLPSPENQTEIAPFAVKNGNVLPIQVLYIDGIPVYFAWNEHPSPYSFPIQPGYHRIGIRLQDNSLSIDSLFVVKGYKNIFSVDVDGKYPKFRQQSVPPELDRYEWNALKGYVAAVHPNKDFDLPYVQSKGQIFKLPTRYTSPSQPGLLFGPVSGEIKFVAPQQYEVKLDHEANFSYEFSEGIVKMRSQDWEKVGMIDLSNKFKYRLDDHPWTAREMNEAYARLLEDRRISKVKHLNWQTGDGEKGDFEFKLNKPEGARIEPLAFVLQDMEYVASGWIYQGSTRKMSKVPSGNYRLVGFFRGDLKFTWENLSVKPGGTNFYELELPDTASTGAYGDGSEEAFFTLAKGISQYLFKEFLDSESLEKIAGFQAGFYKGPLRWLRGQVVDEDGQGIPFATVRVDSTQLGRITDAEGRFSMEIPVGSATLLVTYVGYQPVRMDVSGSSDVLIELPEAAILLEQVEIRSIEVISQMDLVGSSAVVATRSVEGVSPFNGKIRAPKSGGIPAEFGDVTGGVVNPGGETSAVLYIVDGAIWNGSLAELPQDVIRRERLGPEEAMARFGPRAAKGAILLTTAEGLRKQSTADALGEDYMEALANADFLRDNFRDDAFWQPHLRTDEEGRASFQVTFPDDITRWRTFALGFKDGGYTGQTEGEIRSFKPIMAQLRLPRFLLAGDSAYVIGKAVNYSPDSLRASLSFAQDGQEVARLDRRFRFGVDDSALVRGGSGDSTRVRYVMETAQGYKDGEERKIPVYPVGVEEARGYFCALPADTVLQWDFDPLGGEVSIYAETDLVGILRRQVRHLHAYGYLCNEQAASKVMAYLAEKQLCQWEGERFKYERDLRKLIKRLENKQQTNAGWAWWNDGSPIPWISHHVSEALLWAEEAGYEVDFDKEWLAGYGRRIMEDTIWDPERKLRAMELLIRLEVPANFEPYIQALEAQPSPRLAWQFRLIRLKQQVKMPYDIELLEQTRQTDLFGNSYWNETGYFRHLHYNTVQSTLQAYQILKADGRHPEWISGIVGFLLDQRNGWGYWQNTYESAQMTRALLAELGSREEGAKPLLKLSGAIEDTVTKFPFDTTIAPGQPLQLAKPGNYPVYVTGYQRYWVADPQPESHNFKVKSYFGDEKEEVAYLEKGKEAVLTVEVHVDKPAEFVMVEVPIPAGCSYAAKGKAYNELHREYFRHKVAIFAQSMGSSTYTYKVRLLPRFSGTYTLNPAKAEMMYFPLFYGRESVRSVKIQ